MLNLLYFISLHNISSLLAFFILCFTSSLIFLLNSMYLLLHLYAWQLSLHQYPIFLFSLPHQALCSICAWTSSHLFFLILSLFYFIPIPICPTFPLFCAPFLSFHFCACHFSYVSFHLTLIYLIYLHVIVHIFPSYFCTSFSSVHDTSYMHS